MKQPPGQEFDQSHGGCPDTDDGRHLIEWVDVPALRFNRGKLYEAHRRGMCFACGHQFTQEGGSR